MVLFDFDSVCRMNLYQSGIGDRMVHDYQGLVPITECF